MRETLKHIYAIAETFFEWPTEDRTHVTYASACFLAEHVLEQERKEATRLRAAITKTLEENRHLADGENCTLIDLKRAIGMP